MSNAIELTNWDRGKMATILQTTLSNAFSFMEIDELLLKSMSPINDIPALVQSKVWHQPDDKPWSY